MVARWSTTLHHEETPARKATADAEPTEPRRQVVAALEAAAQADGAPGTGRGATGRIPSVKATGAATARSSRWPAERTGRPRTPLTESAWSAPATTSGSGRRSRGAGTSGCSRRRHLVRGPGHCPPARVSGASAATARRRTRSAGGEQGGRLAANWRPRPPSTGGPSPKRCRLWDRHTATGRFLRADPCSGPVSVMAVVTPTRSAVPVLLGLAGAEPGDPAGPAPPRVYPG